MGWGHTQEAHLWERTKAVTNCLTVEGQGGSESKDLDTDRQVTSTGNQSPGLAPPVSAPLTLSPWASPKTRAERCSHTLTYPKGLAKPDCHAPAIRMAPAGTENAGTGLEAAGSRGHSRGLRRTGPQGLGQYMKEDKENARGCVPPLKWGPPLSCC